LLATAALLLLLLLLLLLMSPSTALPPLPLARMLPAPAGGRKRPAGQAVQAVLPGRGWTRPPAQATHEARAGPDAN
jgi:hypothetical protein